MKSLFKKQFTFILYGFVFWLPVLLVLYILFLILSNGENIGRVILLLAIPAEYVYPSFGIILILLIIYFSGFILKATKVGRILSKIPVLGMFFGQGEIITISRLMHMQPCLFLLSPTCISYGWILADENVQLNEEKAGFSLLSVYYPNVPTLVTGQVFAVRKATAMKLGNSSSEVINLLLYAFRSPPFLKYLPWEDESRDEFEERSKIFGLK
jgi:uncharacterized membrane protein